MNDENEYTSRSKTKAKKKIIFAPSAIDGAGIHYDMIVPAENGIPMFVARVSGKDVTRGSITKSMVVIKPLPVSSPLIQHKIVRFASAVGSYDTQQSLVQALRVFLERYVSLTDTQYVICIHYILLTWVYNQYETLPYLRVRGDFGTGKSRFLSAVGGLCYKAMFASGASTVAPLFHLIDQISGTVVLDEADFRFSSETADITKILNNGSSKGFPVLRCQKTKAGTFETVAYRVFGPKVIATRFGFDDSALESRCMTFDMAGLHPDHDVPTALPDSFPDEMAVLQNALLSFRLRNEKGPTRTFEEAGLSRRSLQVYSPLLSMITSKEDRDRVITFAQESQNQMMRDRGMSTAADVLRVLHDHYVKNDTPISIGTLAKKYASLHGSGSEQFVSPKWMGSIVRGTLRLQTRKSHGRYIIAENQTARLESLYRAYDVP